METQKEVMDIRDLQNETSPSRIWSARFEVLFLQQNMYEYGTKDHVWEA